MEMLALLTGQRHTDRPKLVSPVFGNFVRRLNDSLDDDREVLKSYLFRLWNTDDPRADPARAEAALSILVGELAPLVFGWLGLNYTAAELEKFKSGTDIDLAAIRKTVLPICLWDIPPSPRASWSIRCLANELREACENVAAGRTTGSLRDSREAAWNIANCVLCGLVTARHLNRSRDAIIALSQRMLKAMLAVPSDPATAPARSQSEPRPARITVPWYTSSRLWYTSMRLLQIVCGCCAAVYDEIRYRYDNICFGIARAWRRQFGTRASRSAYSESESLAA